MEDSLGNINSNPLILPWQKCQQLPVGNGERLQEPVDLTEDDPGDGAAPEWVIRFDGSEIRRENHLGCINLVNNGIKYQPINWLAGFQPSTVQIHPIFVVFVGYSLRLLCLLDMF